MSNKSTYIKYLIRSCFALCLIILANGLSAQNEFHPFVKNFKAEALDGRLFISWTTKAGFTCQDIHIQLSDDSLQNFTTKGTYFGVCGDATEKDYTYVLDNPILNTLNYLRLELGSYGHSYVISVRVIKAENDVLVIPHPVNSSSVLHYHNPLHEKVQVDFYDHLGRLIKSIESIENSIAVGTISLPRGIVYYHIRGNGSLNRRGTLFIESDI